MKFILFSLVLFALQEKGFYISIEVKEVKGKIFVAVYDSEMNYMIVNEASYIKSIKVRQSHESIFIPLDAGIYAIAVFQDLDNNQSLTTNFLGMPKEPYGFSNDSKGFSGPPDYSVTAMRVEQGESYSIKLQ